MSVTANCEARRSGPRLAENGLWRDRPLGDSQKAEIGKFALPSHHSPVPPLSSREPVSAAPQKPWQRPSSVWSAEGQDASGSVDAELGRYLLKDGEAQQQWCAIRVNASVNVVQH